MDWSNILPILERVAPTIAAVAGGPLAGMAVQTLEGFFGLDAGTGAVDGKPSPALVSAVTAMTPDAMVAIAKIDADLKIKLSDAGVSYAKIDSDDRVSARLMRVASHDPTSSIIGFAVICLWGYVNINLLTTTHAPIVGDMIVGRILGMLDSVTMAFVLFLWGSSRSARDNAATISDIAKG
jgi:hypothetical protein